MTGTQGAQLASVGDRIRNRALVLTTSNLPHELGEVLNRHQKVSDVVAVGKSAPKDCRQVREACPWTLFGVDAETGREYTATPEEPFSLPKYVGLFGAISLADQIALMTADADLAVSPTGRISAADFKTLDAVIAGCNAIADPRLACSLPVDPSFLLDKHRGALIERLRSSEHLVAFSVVAQLDPFEDENVVQGLLEVIETCGSKVMLHRTDMAAVQFLARGGLAAGISGTASMRHCTPPVYRPKTRRNGGNGNKKRGAAVFVPGIDEFRDVDEVRRWYGAAAPYCVQEGCCGRKLTDFDPDRGDDMALLAAHNLRGMLAVVEELHGQEDSRSWLRDYRARVAEAFQELRSKARKKEIKPYASGQVWLALND